MRGPNSPKAAVRDKPHAHTSCSADFPVALALAVAAFVTTASWLRRKADGDTPAAPRTLGMATPAAGSAHRLAGHVVPPFVVGTATVPVLPALLAKGLA